MSNPRAETGQIDISRCQAMVSGNAPSDRGGRSAHFGSVWPSKWRGHVARQGYKEAAEPADLVAGSLASGGSEHAATAERRSNAPVAVGAMTNIGMHLTVFSLRIGSLGRVARHRHKSDRRDVLIGDVSAEILF